MMKEKEITAQIKTVIAKAGGLPVKIWGGGFQKPGVSDLLVCLNGQFIAIEIKKRGGRVTPEQSLFLKKVEQAGGTAFVAYSVEDVIDKLDLGESLFPLWVDKAVRLPDL